MGREGSVNSFITADGWYNYLTTIFQESRHNPEEEFGICLDDCPSWAPVQMEETESLIAALKLGGAPGPDAIPPEAIKAFPQWDRHQEHQDAMLALMLCSLLLLWVLACTAQEIDADDAAEAFKHQYLDFPPSTNLRIDEYCNELMEIRGLTDRKSNTFIRAPYERIEDACNCNGEKQTGLRFIGKNATATMCAAQTRLPDGQHDRYCMRFLMSDAFVHCENGLPIRPYDPVMGFFD
ncbi:UNVERIFIED_CONTAM: hypothetical protein K2H54_035590 [Gekko kuhli]